MNFAYILCIRNILAYIIIKMNADDLLSNPLYNKENLGNPIPNDDHAVSMCLPEWEHIIDYEERKNYIMESIHHGYPRFVYHPLVEQLVKINIREDKDIFGQIYPTLEAAHRALKFLKEHFIDTTITINQINEYGYILKFPKKYQKLAMEYWQHTGEGISSRHAEYLINDRPLPDGTKDQQEIIKKISTMTGSLEENIYLFPSGMAAIYMAFLIVKRVHPDRAFNQFGFPYGDTLKLLEKFNSISPVFYPNGDSNDLKNLKNYLSKNLIAGLFTEFPSNPLLSSVNLIQLRTLANKNHFPIIVDETLGAFTNTNTNKFSDISVISLTKYFSGVGNVMGGALIINPDQPFFHILKPILDQIYDIKNCCSLDLITLNKNSDDFNNRIKNININTLEVVNFLNKHPAIESVWHPSIKNKDLYDKFLNQDGGYGGLLSFLLKNPEEHTIPFYNKLKISKGPNLGTSYSLCCPFIMLAHYNELEWVEDIGISRWLIRLSIGLETTEEIIKRLDDALSCS